MPRWWGCSWLSGTRPCKKRIYLASLNVRRVQVLWFCFPRALSAAVTPAQVQASGLGRAAEYAEAIERFLEHERHLLLEFPAEASVRGLRHSLA